MTSPLPPRRRDSRNLADLIRQDRTNLKQLAPGFAGGRFPPARLRGHDDGDDGVDDDGDDLIQFANRDQGVCSGPGANITIPLSHTPEDGSEQVFYNGTPLKRGDWTRTDSVLTIPGEQWFRAGKVAWVDYAYYDQDPDTEPAAFVSVTMISGNWSTIALPGTPNAGDMLVLTMRARDAATCSDPRMAAKNVDGGGKWGQWVGTDDGTGTPLAINLSGVSGAGDACAALMRITGSPLLPVTSEASSSGSSSPFTPTMPTAGTFGVMAMTSGTGLVAGGVSGDTLGNWTTRAYVRGDGPGFASVYIGTAPGVPAGQWVNAGGSPVFTAWAGGIQ